MNMMCYAPTFTRLSDVLGDMRKLKRKTDMVGNYDSPIQISLDKYLIGMSPVTRVYSPLQVVFSPQKIHNHLSELYGYIMSPRKPKTKEEKKEKRNGILHLSEVLDQFYQYL